MNLVGLTGRAVKDWELRFTPNGKAVANGVIAVQRKFKNQEGKYDADFIDLVAWSKTGELLAQYVKKGDPYSVAGAIQTRTYENKEGKKVKVTEINVSEFDFPVRSKGSDGQQTKPSEPNMQDKDPFAGSPIDISDDDLPF